MNARFAMGALALLLVAADATQARAQDISGEAAVGLASKYVWRGLVIDNEPSLQPSVSLSSRGFTLGFWGNLELTDWNNANYERPGRGRFREIDLTMEYAQDAWWAGVGDYHFPGTGWERWQEFYAGYSFDAPGSPWISLAWGEKSGTSATVGLSHSFAAGSRSLDANLEVSWSDRTATDFFYGHRTSGFTDAMFSIGTEIDAGRGFVLTPRLHASTLLSSHLLEGEPRRSNVWASLELRFSF